MRRGFTLVEMLVVLAILGITAAAVTPAIARATHQDDLTRAAGRLADVLAAARAASLVRAVPVTVGVIPENGRYRLLLDDGATLDSGTIALVGGVRLVSIAPRPAFRFEPIGIADGDSLRLLGPTGALALVVDRWTGEPRVEPR